MFYLINSCFPFRAWQR